jgi:hypothetical protein
MGTQVERLEVEISELLRCVSGLAAEPSPTVLRLKDLAMRVEAAVASARAEREADAIMGRIAAQHRDAVDLQRAEVAAVEAQARASVEQATGEALRATVTAAEQLATTRREEAEVLLTFSRSKIESFYRARRRALEGSRAHYESMTAEATRAGGPAGEHLAESARRGRQLVEEELADLGRKEALVRRATLGM